MAAKASRADAAQQLFDVFHAVRRATLDRFNEDGVSFARAKVLWALEQRGPVRASVLAQQLDCAAATATELVDALVRDDLAARTPDPGDRRAVLIDLTTAGRDLARRTGLHKRQILEGIFDCLDVEQIDQLATLLGKLAESPNLQGAHA